MILFIDGLPAAPEDLACLALTNYGAYTSFRVEEGGARGLDLHLARLDASAVELFGDAVGEDRLRALMRRALDGRADAWLRVSLFSPRITHRDPTWRGAPQVMVGVFDPPPPLAASLRLQVQTHAREAAHLKHTATFSLMRARRMAREAGYDDALFVDDQGIISEGSLWNIGFVTGDRVTWPEAPSLAGVTQALIERGLEAAGMTSGTGPVPLSELRRFQSAFICNSATPACPVTAIGDHGLEVDADLIARLQAAWAWNPIQPI